MTYDCRICVCVFFYSFFKTFFHRKRNQKAVRSRFDESVRSAQRTKRKISSFLSLHFYPRKSSIADLIAKKCFPSLPLLSSFLRPARTRYEILFPSFSLCFPFFAFFASKRFALRRFVVAVFLSLSLSRGIPGGKSMDRHRAIFHASPLPLLFRARLFATETAEDFSFSRLFSFLDEMKRRAMISSHRLPLLPGRRRAKDRFGVSGKKYSHSSLSLSLSLSLYFHHHPSHDEHKTEHREEGCLEEQQQHGREERGVVGGDHRHHLFFRRRVGGRHRRRVRRHLRQGPRRFWRQIAAKISG